MAHCRLSARSSVALGTLLALSASTPAGAALQIRWGPVLSDMEPTRAAVAWTTTQPARSRLICDGRQYRSAATGVYHAVELEGLAPNAEHEYYVEAFAADERAESDRFVFRAPPANLSQWSFIAFGDTQSRHDKHREVLDAIMRVTPRPWLALHTGDLVADGNSPAAWDTFFRIERPLVGTIPFYPTPGNHGQESDLYYNTFPVPPGGGPHGKAWYCFPFANALFVVLNSEAALDPQAAYLEQQLVAAAEHGIRWRFVVWHRPPFASGPHGGCTSIQERWVPILDRHGATCVFSGHNHGYEHSLRKGIHYVVTAGGGGPLYPVGVKPNPYSVKSESCLHFTQVMVTPTAVALRALRTDGTVVEHFVIR